MPIIGNRVALIESSHDAFEQYGRRNNLVISDIPDSVHDSDLESTVTSILSDIDVNVESREVEDCHRIGKSNNGSKKTIIRFINRNYWRKALLNKKQLERIDLKKHQFLSGKRIFINEHLMIKNEHLAFNCRQLKKGTIYLAHLRRTAQFTLNKMKILGQW